jgi:hypothetical protein
MRTHGILILALLLGACTSSRNAGFLTDYSRLKPDEQFPGDLFWEKPGVDLRVYDRLIIDPVVVIVDEDSKAAALGDEALRRVASGYSRILRETIAPYYTVVKEPGPTVLRLRIAITDVEPALKSAEDPMGVSVGRATTEAEMIDSATGEQLAASIDRLEGSESGTGDVPEEWRHVEGAFIEWANRILDYIDARYEEPLAEVPWEVPEDVEE